MNKTFLDYNNEYLLTSQESPIPRNPLVYWPSEASAIINGKAVGSCHRSVYWRIKGEPYSNLMILDTKRKCLMGSAFEDSEQELTKENPAFSETVNNYKVKANITNDIIISGEFDSIVKLSGTNKYKIIEYKSGGGYFYRKEVFGEYGQPKDYYLFQVMLYLDIVNKIPELEEKNITEAEIHCIDREKCQTIAHTVKLQNGYPVINGDVNLSFNIKDIHDRYKKLHYSVINDILPPCDIKPYISMEEVNRMKKNKEIPAWKHKMWKKQGYGSEFPCPYCNYRDRCLYENGHLSKYEKIGG